MNVCFNPHRKRLTVSSLLPFQSQLLKNLIVQRFVFILLTDWIPSLYRSEPLRDFLNFFFKSVLSFVLYCPGCSNQENFYLPDNTYLWDKFFCGLDLLLFLPYKESEVPFIKSLSQEVKWLIGQEREFTLNTVWYLHCLWVLFDPEHRLNILFMIQSCLIRKFRCHYSFIKTDYIAPIPNKLLY